MTAWFKGGEWASMVLGHNKKFPGGAIIWFSSLVFHMGDAWKKESAANKTKVTGISDEAAAPVLTGWLLVDMTKAYGSSMANAMIRMLQAMDVLIRVYKIIKEPTPTPESRGDVALRHGLAMAELIVHFEAGALSASQTTIFHIALYQCTRFMERCAPPAPRL